MNIFLALVLIALPSQAQAQQNAAPLPPKFTEAIALQVALDRAGFSSGVIDGRVGTNTRRAETAFRQQNGRDPEPFAEPLRAYAITAEDAAGPFVENIPSDLVEQSKLPALSYRSIQEALAERFHTTPEVLRLLNPEAAFTAGTEITVPNVEPLAIVATPPPAPQPAPQTTGVKGTSGRSDRPDVVVTISKALSAATVTDAGGKVIFFAPVTTGSEHDPLPIGEWKVNVVQYNPKFRYNPDLFWDADPTHTKATIPAGPNGPVGLVWIDISKEHYGLHGSPEPAQIGRTQSHGCVRLTNWDAIRLASLVKPGTRVVFTE
ncbi:MAG TPA: L,D-transpeptidase [Vicinamibacterales bacterium]|jgi:lipoprotein-anchoring transpeptidase ErfK/SrfK